MAFAEFAEDLVVVQKLWASMEGLCGRRLQTPDIIGKQKSFTRTVKLRTLSFDIFSQS